MTAIHTPIRHTDGERRTIDCGHPADAAIARVVERCDAFVIDPSVAPDGDVIAAAIEASATGGSVYTATDGEGLLRMAPALFRASDLGLPIVMSVGSSAARTDHGHAMALRDCGWVQLYPTDYQDAVDTHIQAFRIAESLSLPVMVCLDALAGHPASARPRVPCGAEIDSFLTFEQPHRGPRRVTAAEAPDLRAEVRYLTHAKQSAALEAIWQVAADFRAQFGRRSGGVMSIHRLYGARLAVLGLGSTFEAITGAVDEARRHGVSVGALGLRSFRPFPTQTVATELLRCERVMIVERAIAVGIGGIVSTDVRSALARLPIKTHTVIAGLGGRPISAERLERVIHQAAHGVLEEISFLDLDPAILKSPESPAHCSPGA
jgi:pyruvate ferredoxin oxidoreductase alpha subunit